MIRIFADDATVFTTNGLGVLLPEYAEVSEVLNGAFTCKVQCRQEDRIVVGRILMVPTPDGVQPFRVYRVEQNIDHEIVAYGMHLFYDLRWGLMKNTYIDTKTGTAALTTILTGTDFTAYSDITAVSSARYVYKSYAESILNADIDESFVNRWGGEIERDGYTVKMLARRGADRSVYVRYKKNLTGLDLSFDESGVFTRIYPTGLQADGTTLLKIDDDYVDSPNAADFPQVRAVRVHFGDIKVSDDLTEADAKTALIAAANAMFTAGLDAVTCTGSINFVDLSQTIEYASYAVLEHVYLGDTIHVVHPDLGAAMETRVVEYNYDPILGRYRSISVGAVAGNFAQALATVQQKATVAKDATDALSVKTDAINTALGGYVLKRDGELLIMDTEDPATATKIWRWNLGGLGYSSSGYSGPWTIAITQDGEISADFITTGTLIATIIKAGILGDSAGNFLLDLATGSVTAKSIRIEVDDPDNPGTTLITITDAGADFPKITAGEIEADNISIAARPMVLSAARSYYWDPEQTGDGTASDNAAPDLQALVNSIPRLLDTYVDVRLASGAVWNGALNMRGIRGQVVTVYGNGASINGALNIRYCDHVHLQNLNMSNAVIEGSTVTFSGGSVNTSTEYGILLARSRGILSGVEINTSAKAGLYVVETSIATMITGCKGDCTDFVWCDRGGTLFLNDKRPYGNIIANAGLGQVLGTATATHGSGYVPPPEPDVQTITLNAIASRTRNANSGWRSDAAILQGEFVNGSAPFFYGANTGCMWFDTLTVPAGYSVTGIRIWLRRINAGGYPSAQKVRLWHLTAPATDNQGSLTKGASIPNTANDSDAVGNYIGTLNRDEAKWFDIPTTVATELDDGKGLCIYTGITHSTELPEYIQLHGFGSSYPPKIEVTCTKDA